MRIRVLVPVLAAITVGAVVTAPTATAVPDPTDSPRQAIARAYVDALVSHDSSAVQFTPDAKRFENGLQTGTSGPQLKNDLATGLQYRVIRGVRDLTLTEIGTTVTARFLMDTVAPTVFVSETIEVPTDAISLLVADIKPA